MIKAYFRLALKGIRQRKLRSWLTILGVALGIVLIISLLSLGEGLKTTVLRQLQMLGTDTIFIFPGEEANPFFSLAGLELSVEDVEVVEKTKGVDLVVPMFTRAMPLEYKGQKKLVLMCGHPWKGTLEFLKNSQGWSLYKGKWPKEKQPQLTVGYAVATKTFKKEIDIGNKVNIGGKDFEIAGIVNPFGDRSFNTMVSIDLKYLREITGEKKPVNIIITRTASEKNIDKVAAEIEKNLRKKRGLEDFTVLTNKKAIGVVGNVMGVIEWIVVGIASIALLVGGVGIMTTMYTSVHERIKEIGVMKAVGATNRSILSIFLIEAGIMGLAGGVIGIILGLGLAKLVEEVVHRSGFTMLKAAVTPELILLGLAFSFLIGCISGVFPARQAAKLNPVDALRYE